MNQRYTPPSTMDGIRRLATQIKHELNIKHTNALDKAAVIAGYQNFKHASRLLSSDQPVTLYLTCYWRDFESPRLAGRCTGMVQLPAKTVQLIDTLKARGYMMLGGFDLESFDHLRARSDAMNEERAIRLITDAVRELQFCAATGLRRVRTQADKRMIPSLQELPGRDHTSYWTKPGDGNWLALDEPYMPRYVSSQNQRRIWLAQHHLHEVGPNWEGLYFPGSTFPYIVSSDKEFLLGISRTVEKLKPVLSINWDTHSGTYFSHFHSPQRIASGKRYRPRSQPSFGERNGAVPYGGQPGTASDWRPAKSMTIKEHSALGVLLNRLAWSDLPVRAHDKLQHIISMMDDWSYLEHREDQISRLDLLYYGEKQPPFEDICSLRAAVVDACSLIRSGYNECRPRRDLLHALEAIGQSAIKLLEKKAA
jgi:hypothetical protein